MPETIPVTFPKVLTMGRSEAESFIAGPQDVCISIGSPGASDARLSPNFRDVLRVAFHDIPWVPTPEGATQINGRIARAIVEFAARNRDAKRLVVHCAAGVSRSVSVAAALTEAFTGQRELPAWFANRGPSTADDGRIAPNLPVYSIVLRAAQTILAKADREARGPDAAPIIPETITGT